MPAKMKVNSSDKLSNQQICKFECAK